jgi:hypothetical protein
MNLRITLREVISWSVEQPTTPEVISCTVWFLIYLFIFRTILNSCLNCYIKHVYIYLLFLCILIFSVVI